MSRDPFAFDDEDSDDDRTLLRPPGSHTPPTDAGARSAAVPGHASLLPPQGGINPLEKAASRLLPLMLVIRHSASHPDPQQLRNRLIRELQSFKQQALPILGDQKKVTQASYILCTALDDAAMNTPWAHQANWSQHNLLATFHNEVIGGERFFALLKRLGKQPRENIDLLELMYLCLALGYEGSYRIARDGQNTLVRIRNWLYEIISDVRGNPERALSVHWQGSGVQPRRLPTMTVVWVSAAAALALCSLSYLAFRHALSDETDATIAALFAVQSEPVQIRAVAPPALPPASSSSAADTDTLTRLLQQPIDLGLVEVADSFNEGRVRLLGDNLFASGSDEPDPTLLPLLTRISEAMNRFRGDILITGHSDNIPVRSGRFASNLALSQARAESVAELMRERIDDMDRLRAEGRGSLEPIADNASASGRARNRRVEITLFY